MTTPYKYLNPKFDESKASHTLIAEERNVSDKGSLILAFLESLPENPDVEMSHHPAILYAAYEAIFTFAGKHLDSDADLVLGEFDEVSDIFGYER